jgi:hypothetical protein
MPISPISIGDARVSHHQLTIDGGAPFLLGGLLDSAITMHVIDTSSGAERTLTGTWHITNAGNGYADFSPSPGDVATPGRYSAYPVVMTSTGPVAMDAQKWEILNNT